MWVPNVVEIVVKPMSFVAFDVSTTVVPPASIDHENFALLYAFTYQTTNVSTLADAAPVAVGVKSRFEFVAAVALMVRPPIPPVSSIWYVHALPKTNLVSNAAKVAMLAMFPSPPDGVAICRVVSPIQLARKV